MELRPGYKQTELGVLPDDWKVVPLSSVCSMKSGETITSSYISSNGSYPCYGGNGLRGYTARFTHEGSFCLIGRQGALCGNVFEVNGRFFASEHAVVVTANPEIFIPWLTYVLRDMNLNQYSESSAQPGLSVAKLALLPIACPPFSEQKAIAAALSDVDALLDSLGALIAKKRDMKKAAMQELLTGKTRLPGFSGAWVEKSVDELAELGNDRIIPFKTPKCKLCVELEHIVPNEGKLCGHTKPSLVSTTKSAFEVENILFGRLRAYLKKFWFADSPGACSTEIWVLKARKECVAPRLLYYLIQTQDFIDASSVTYGTHMPRSEWKTVKDVAFRIPENLEEQQAIADVLSDMDAEIEALEVRYAKVKDMKTGMMQELLTGKTRLVPTGEQHG